MNKLFNSDLNRKFEPGTKSSVVFFDHIIRIFKSRSIGMDIFLCCNRNDFAVGIFYY